MDRKQKRKKQNTRVVITNIFMALSVVAIVAILLLVAMGYSITPGGGISQSGLIEINSRPSGAVVEIDGNAKFERTKISSMQSAGDHNLRVTKPGYDTWERTINVEPGILTNIDWIRLFPVQPEISEVGKFAEIRLASFSSNRKNLILLEKNSNHLYYIDLQGNEINKKSLKLNKVLNSDMDTVQTGTLSVVSWNRDGNKVLIKWIHEDDSIEFLLVNLKDEKQTINLSHEFNLAFDRIRFANDAASKLWVVENGNLHTIDVANRTISATLARNVEVITNDRDVVIFVNTDDNGLRAIRSFKEGESGASVVKTLENTATKSDDGTEDASNTTPSDAKKSVITLAMGTYWSSNWLAYTKDSKLFVLTGSYPSFDKPSNSALKEKLSIKLGYTPKLVSVNEEQRLVVFAADKKITSIDLETLHHYAYEVGVTLGNLNWLDEYLLWQIQDNKIVVRDFDSHNRREIITDVDNQLGVYLTENNNWLYYFTTRQEVDTSLITNCATTETSTENNPAEATNCIGDTAPTRTVYVLNREKLKI